jgi:hypothetical protein
MHTWIRGITTRIVVVLAVFLFPIFTRTLGAASFDVKEFALPGGTGPHDVAPTRAARSGTRASAKGCSGCWIR